jgi:hypothetical protein
VSVYCVRHNFRSIFRKRPIFTHKSGITAGGSYLDFTAACGYKNSCEFTKQVEFRLLGSEQQRAFVRQIIASCFGLTAFQIGGVERSAFHFVPVRIFVLGGHV